MADLYESGMTVQEVATELECSHTTVKQALDEHGIEVRRKTFSEEEQRRIVKLYESGLTQQEVAEKIGCSLETVRQVRRKHGVKVRQRFFSAEERRRMADLHRGGLSHAKIADKFGCRPSVVTKVLAREDSPKKRTDKRFKLSDQKRRRIVDLYEKGLTQKEIAEKCGCSIETVRRIRRKYGVEARRTTFSSKDEQRIVKLYKSGLSQKEVAAQFGCYHLTVKKILDKLGVERRRSGRQREFTKHECRRMATLHEEGWSLPDIASEFFCSRRLVEVALHRLGISTPPPPPVVRRGSYTPEERRQMADLYRSGLSVREVAVEIGCNVETVSKTLDKLGIKRRRNEARWSKFSPEDRQVMFELFESGMSTSEIAAKFGCDTRYVSQALRRLGVKTTRRPAQAPKPRRKKHKP